MNAKVLSVQPTPKNGMISAVVDVEPFDCRPDTDLAFPLAAKGDTIKAGQELIVTMQGGRIITWYPPSPVKKP